MDNGTVGSVSRAIALLTAFEEQDDGLTVTELARRTGLYKSTALRLLGTLESHGFIQKRSGGLYFVGPAVWRLGQIFESSRDVHSMVLPVLRHVTDVAGETSLFAVREEGFRVNLAYVDAQHQVRVHVRVGAVRPLGQGATSRVLIDFEDGPGDVRGTDLIYSSFGENNPEMAGVAVPVFGSDGALVGALSMVGTLVRFSDEELLGRVREAVLDGARELSQSLGSDASIYDVN